MLIENEGDIPRMKSCLVGNGGVWALPACCGLRGGGMVKVMLSCDERFEHSGEGLLKREKTVGKIEDVKR